MSSRLRSIVLVSTLGLVFAYGFAAGSYRLFPFYQVAWLKNSLTSMLSSEAPAYIPATPFSVEIKETAIQRLLVKRVPLPNTGEDFVAGGALASTGDVLYAVNRDGQPYVFDLAAEMALAGDVPAAPINRDDLLVSDLRYQLPNGWFRTAGAHVETTPDSTDLLFVYHNRLDVPGECITYNISRIELARRDTLVTVVEPWETILTTDPCMEMQPEGGFGRYPWSGHISGGKILEYDEDRLLVTVGDFNFDGYLRDAWSMDTTNLYGKYVLVDKRTGAAETFALGGRNNMGLHRDRSGTIWSTESGPQGGDELNVVTRGANFGWPEVTYGINYETNPWPLNPSQGRHSGYQTPVFAWFPSVVPTNLVRVDSAGGRFSLWHGDLVIGSLKDESLHRLRLDGDGRVVYDERIPFQERIRDLIGLEDGRIAFLTDNSGHLVILDDGGPAYSPIDTGVEVTRLALERLDALTTDEARNRSLVVSGEGLFEQKCSSCHALTPEHRVGPHLDGLFARGIGAADGYRYSYELGASQDQWTDERLRSYLIDPEGSFPGSRMQRVSLAAPELDSIISYLQRAQDSNE